jgi:hypothetical protein
VLKVAFYFADSSQQELNTSMHRIFSPAKMLEEAGHECRIAHVSSLFASRDMSNALWADAVVIERLLVKETHDAIEKLVKMGKKVFCTFDDAYHIIPGTPSYDAWRGGKEARGGRGSILNEFRAGLRICTGALVPSRVLLEDYRPYQPNIYYVPNYLYPPLWENLPKANPDVVTIGWGGTTLHNLSWKESGLIPAIGKLSQELPKVQVHLQPAYPEIIAAFKKMGVRYVTSDWQPFEEWPRTVSQFAIGVAPLSGNYDTRRSNLKVLEYATLGIPWVATNDAPYKDSCGGLRVENKSNVWYKALRDVVKDRELYEQLSREGKVWASSFNVGCVKRYEEVFNG